MYSQLNNAHPIIGITVVALILFQPIFGLSHHYVFVRTARRTFWATVHVWLGRALITLGIINGGLGLQLSDNTRAGEIVYGIVAALVALVYVTVVVLMGRRKNSGGIGTGVGRSEKGSPGADYSSSPDGSGVGMYENRSGNGNGRGGVVRV